MANDICSVFVIGRLTKEMALSYTNAKKAVGKISLAVNRRYKQNEQLVEEVSYFDIVVFGKQAENLTYENGTLSIKGSGLMSIYNTNGALISVANVKEGANVSLEGLPTGIYIVRMGDKAIKVKK